MWPKHTGWQYLSLEAQPIAAEPLGPTNLGPLGKGALKPQDLAALRWHDLKAMNPLHLNFTSLGMLVAHTDFSSRSGHLEISPKHPWIDFLRSRVSTIMDTASGMMAVTTGDSDMTVLMAGDSNVIDVIAEDSCMVAITA